MPNTFQLISSVTIGSGGAASVLFSSIPSTYTDLQLMLSLRANNAATQVVVDIKFNGSSANYDLRYLGQSNTSVVSYTRASGFGTNMIGYYPGANATASTFGNVQLYIPNYAGSTHKSLSLDAVMENNSTTIQNGLLAGLWSQTAAITSLEFTETGGGNIAQHSTAYLYGVKNA
jgi:hypothetical protein